MGEVFWYAVIYSFLGWLLEGAHAWALQDRPLDRRCLCLLPLCPVYGLGALLILSAAPALEGRPLLLALWSGAAATGAEWAMGLFYEKVLRVSFWDYSGLAWSWKGRVCLRFSLYWCLLGLLVVYALHPLCAALAARIPSWLALPAALLTGADALWSAVLLRRSGSPDALRWYVRRAQAAQGQDHQGPSQI